MYLLPTITTIHLIVKVLKLDCLSTPFFSLYSLFFVMVYFIIVLFYVNFYKSFFQFLSFHLSLFFFGCTLSLSSQHFIYRERLKVDSLNTFLKPLHFVFCDGLFYYYTFYVYFYKSFFLNFKLSFVFYLLWMYS